MRDRSKIVTLAVLTGPLAWYALAGCSDDPAVTRAAGGQHVAAVPSTAGSPSTTRSPAAPSTSPGASPTPADPPVVQAGTGQVQLVPGTTAASGPGTVTRYSVSVEGGLGVDAAAFAATVDATLADPRSWGHTGKIAFRRVDSGPVDVKVVLASPTLTDRMCAPLLTKGLLSCGNGNTAVLNSYRWLRGADAYSGHLPEYRQYVVNHEVGHTIGHHHEQCGGPGQLAPVMMQQTKGVGACVASPWPFP